MGYPAAYRKGASGYGAPGRGFQPSPAPVMPKPYSNPGWNRRPSRPMIISAVSCVLRVWRGVLCRCCRQWNTLCNGKSGGSRIPIPGISRLPGSSNSVARRGRPTVHRSGIGRICGFIAVLLRKLAIIICTIRPQIFCNAGLRLAICFWSASTTMIIFVLGARLRLNNGHVRPRGLSRMPKSPIRTR